MTDPDRPRARKRTASLPTFHQPPTPDPDPDPYQDQATSTPDLPPRPARMIPGAGAADFSDGAELQRDLPIPRLGRAALTDTSGTTDDDDRDQVDPKLVVVALVALIGIGCTLAAVLVKRARPGRTLRRPAKADIRAVAKPTANILLRHVSITKLSPDLVDGIEIAGAVGRYVEGGPLTVPDVDANLPDDLPTDESEQYS